jgi:hypothetical protein
MSSWRDRAVKVDKAPAQQPAEPKVSSWKDRAVSVGDQTPSMSGLEGAWDTAEKTVAKALDVASPILEPIAKFSKTVTDPIIEGSKKTNLGAFYNILKDKVSEAMPGRPSDIVPSIYSNTGEGFKLKKEGIFDPTYKEAQDTMERMVLDPMNIMLPAATNVLGKVIKGATKTVASGLSGLPKKVVETYLSKADDVNKLITSTPDELPNKVFEKVKTKINDAVSVKGKQISEVIKKAGSNVDVSVVRKSFDDLLDKLEEYYYKNPNEVTMKQYETAQKIRDNYFAKGVNTLDADAAFKMQQDMKDLMRLSSKTEIGSSIKDLPVGAKNITDAANKSYHALNEEFKKITGGMSKKLKDEYSRYMELQDMADGLFGSPDKTFKTLKTANNKAKKNVKVKIKEIDKEFGTNISPDVDLMEAYTYLEDPSITPISSGGTTSTSRTLTGAGIGGVIGGGTGSFFGMPGVGATVGSTIGTMASSPAAVKRYMDLLLKYKSLNKLPSTSVPIYRGAVEGGKKKED